MGVLHRLGKQIVQDYLKVFSCVIKNIYIIQAHKSVKSLRKWERILYYKIMHLNFIQCCEDDDPDDKKTRKEFI